MKRVSIDFERFKSFLVKNKILVGAFIFLLISGLILIPKAFAQPVKSVEIISDSASFEEKDLGAWKVDKSAKWTGRGEAEITFDVDSIMKSKNKNTDVLLVLDVSDSMAGDKLNKIKSDTTELVERLLSTEGNNVGLITFQTKSTILSKFTNDEDELIKRINSLSTAGCTNFYRALINVDTILKDYVIEKDRDCIVLFLTDGYPNEETPNEEIQYGYLRQRYPFVIFNGIQYEMGDTILAPIKKVSETQFIADMRSLNNVLFEASVNAVVYDNFEITDYIDVNYFYVEDESKIKVSHGSVVFNKDDQKVTWVMNDYKSGINAKMTIGVKLKEELINKGGLYPTNIKEEIKSKFEDAEENIVSVKTPILVDNYKVVYDANVPSGCNIEGNLPETENHSVFDVVGISDESLKCEGYKFNGWKIATDSVRLSDKYFVMPEEDVVIRAEWSKISLDKSMNGKVYVYEPVTLESYNGSSSNGLHKYKDSITNIVFQNTVEPIYGAIDVLDISAEKNNELTLYIVPNKEDSGKYTAYIQSYAKIMANSDSSYLFSGFVNLKSIKNLEYLNTSRVTDMSYMFNNCSSLASLDVSSFDTSKVIDMSYMFYRCSSLTNLNISGINTSKVTDMSFMFSTCSKLSTINFWGFQTSNVVSMSSMFGGCTNLSILNLSSFDTSRVSDMGHMFSGCSNLSYINMSNFTWRASEMGAMFYGCSSLTDMNISNLNISYSTSTNYMFYDCNNLNITVTIGCKISYYQGMFEKAATEVGSQIIVDYKPEIADMVDNYIATKSDNSNVIKKQ